MLHRSQDNHEKESLIFDIIASESGQLLADRVREFVSEYCLLSSPSARE